MIREQVVFHPESSVSDAERLASIIRLRGGEEILEKLREASDLPKPQPE